MADFSDGKTDDFLWDGWDDGVEFTVNMILQ
jgi:hypothetical protein